MKKIHGLHGVILLTWTPCQFRVVHMSRRQSLVAKARAVGRGRRITKDDIDLALAWMRRDVSMTEAAVALEMSGGTALYRIAICLRAAYEQGRLQEAA
jgi:hypothetical protein